MTWALSRVAPLGPHSHEPLPKHPVPLCSQEPGALPLNTQVRLGGSVVQDSSEGLWARGAVTWLPPASSILLSSFSGQRLGTEVWIGSCWAMDHVIPRNPTISQDRPLPAAAPGQCPLHGNTPYQQGRPSTPERVGATESCGFTLRYKGCLGLGLPSPVGRLAWSTCSCPPRP